MDSAYACRSHRGSGVGVNVAPRILTNGATVQREELRGEMCCGMHNYMLTSVYCGDKRLFSRTKNK